ncbi:DNA-protecting protein DprA [bacterium]|nr:DNA-protecting protein DprA [bacterium]
MESELKRLSPSDFPLLLSEIPDKPKQLFVRGTLPSYDSKWIAVVGSRAISPYGRQVIQHLFQGLRGYPIVIVSGLAYGVDALAHKTALEMGLITVGVPGSGLDWSVLYPRANVSLTREIIEKGGALVSEFEPKIKAADYTFPQRNRIMAGLCHATLVIEAQEKSGSLITARLTTEYNRELLVVPGSIFSDTSRGTHQFLKLGATPITDAADILDALGIEKKENDERRSLEHLDENERRVMELLSFPLSRDELLESLEMATTDVQVLLSLMEIKGLIVEEVGLIRRT